MGDDDAEKLSRGLAAEWLSTLTSCRALPPPRQGTERPASFATRIYALDSVPVPRLFYDRASRAPVNLRLRATLLHAPTTAFFGTKWESEEVFSPPTSPRQATMITSSAPHTLSDI